MTAIYRIPESISVQLHYRSRPVNPNAIKAVIPTYRDWEGLKTTLDSLLNLKTPPKEIVVANDNGTPEVPSWLAQYPVQLTSYVGNLRPAGARNRGFGLIDEIPADRAIGGILRALQTGQLPDYVRNGTCPELKHEGFSAEPKRFVWEGKFDWVYFTDCGCTHSHNLFEEFERAWHDRGDCCVAISGPVTGSASGLINQYMTHQGHLNPPRAMAWDGVYLPQAIVTANALVASLPFAFVGGFDPSFPEAAAEDIDLGIRLRELGVIAFADRALVSHQFDENEDDFCKRFRRYGRGNRRLELKHNLPSLRSKPFDADKKIQNGSNQSDLDHQRLADLAHRSMCEGYDEEARRSDRGVLRVAVSPKR